MVSGRMQVSNGQGKLLPTQVQTVKFNIMDLEAEWHPKGGYFPTQNMVTEYGSFQDPNIEGAGGLVEMVMALNGSCVEFWHPDGRHFRIRMNTIMNQAAEVFLKHTANPPPQAQEP